MIDRLARKFFHAINQKSFTGIGFRLSVSLAVSLVLGYVLGLAYLHGDPSLRATVTDFTKEMNSPIRFNAIALLGIFLLGARIAYLGRTAYPKSSIQWGIFYSPLLGSLTLLVGFTGFCIGLSIPNRVDHLAFAVLIVSPLVMAFLGAPLLFMLWAAQPGKVFNELQARWFAGIAGFTSLVVLLAPIVKSLVASHG